MVHDLILETQLYSSTCLRLHLLPLIIIYLRRLLLDKGPRDTLLSQQILHSRLPQHEVSDASNLATSNLEAIDAICLLPLGVVKDPTF